MAGLERRSDLHEGARQLFLRKMVAIAGLLGGVVVGDDGEHYTGDEPLDEYLRG